ncbi:heterokaryon incompatibility protein-domain-containing protein [Annulohypoxylon nitens]|nr:heterokaryon incompatibility protein-domain-containing protein [Annulohypoxylon nitens]
MWLINIHSLELELFVGNRIPEYAILSHRWGDKEASFEKFQSRQYDSREGGYEKIWNFCAQVAEGKGSINYAWVDTCCIDKRSSAELSESINSMFKWYRDAQICYVYLSDADDQAPDIEYELRKSQWFLRGWTLQEIVAPREILFFSKTWGLLGSKSKLPLYRASIAQRMSWASCRSTTREEDIAYSLLGIFDINMPLLYGEGSKAFTRLQEEIIKQTKDDSILAWGYNLPRNRALAAHPSWFAGCDSVVRCGARDHWSRSVEITNKDEPTLSHGIRLISIRGLELSINVLLYD